MAYGNWDGVLKSFYGLGPRYVDFARGMIELIPILRNRPELADVTPGTSHFVFFVTIDNMRTKVYVRCDHYPDQYHVCLYSSRENRNLEEVTVPHIEVMATILFYVRKLRLIAEKNKFTL